VEKKPKPFMTATAGWHRKMLGLNAPIIPTKGILGFLVMWIRIFSCCAISFKTLPFPEKLKGF
jgi:hypothetical protein